MKNQNIIYHIVTLNDFTTQIKDDYNEKIINAAKNCRQLLIYSLPSDTPN